MPEQITFDTWPLGWAPSSSDQNDFGSPNAELLRMDNLNLDERGSVRLSNRPGLASGNLAYQINSIFGAYIAKKLRYLYDNSGNFHRNFNGAGLNTITDYDLLIGGGGTTLKAAFLNALGHVILLAGGSQFKDRGDIQWPLQIPQPTAPVLTNQAASVIDLNNLSAGTYTNWTAPTSSAFANGGATITVTGNVTSGVAAIQTIYAALQDTTNFGVTGEDNDSDPFSFTLQIDDPSQLSYIRVDFYCQDPTGTVTDWFYAEYDYGTTGTIYSAVNTFPIGTPTEVVFTRGQFFRQGANTTGMGWDTIKAVRITIGCTAATGLTFSTLKVGSGAVLGDQTYVAVEVNDTGQFVQYSIASAQVVISASINYIKVDRSGAACNAQCNGIRFFRNNTTLGQFIEVSRQTGVYGFTPAFFVDNLSDDAALTAATLDPDKFLKFFRIQLPTNIVGGIFFASRVIYITPRGFFPTYQLDFGSYDSRFFYDLVGDNSESCLFIAKLSVGTFIVATTKDFYQVSGTFSFINITNADGTVVTIQDVNILALGVSDPAINSSFFELEGSIFYMSSSGFRSMANGSSTLLNTTIDLLFRNETRYGFPPIAMQPNDLSLIGMVVSGNRLYLALPFANGANAVLVSTFNSPGPADLRGSTYWRPLLVAPLCLFKELDGTVIYGDQGKFVGTLETEVTGISTIDFGTKFSYGQYPNQAKDVGAITLSVNTGGFNLTLLIFGLQEDGTILTFTANLLTNSLTAVTRFNPSADLQKCVGFACTILGNTDTFELGYIVLTTIQEYPPITYYAIVPFTNFDKTTAKLLAKWGFIVDPLGNPITVKVTSDNVVLATQTIQPEAPETILTAFWTNLTHFIGLDWQIEVFAPNGMKFFKFLPPDVVVEFPTITYYAIVPFANLGKDTLKKLAKWGFIVDTLGNTVTVKVTADNQVMTQDIVTSLEPQGITTEFWFNDKDVAGLDWQIELIAPLGMRFYKFMSPDVLQVFPPGRIFDQAGPLDLDKEGIVFGFRIRVLTTSAALSYQVLDNDTVTYTNSITTTPNIDLTYEETFPKGVNTSVVRLLMSAGTQFYRFSLEFKVRTTGNETEQKWIKV